MIYKPYSITMQMTGITRKAAAEILSAAFSCPYEFNREENAYVVKDRADREWKVEQNNDILCQQKKEDTIIGANFLYSVEVTTPFLYERDFPLIEEMVKGLQEAGALTNESTNISIRLKHNGYGITDNYSGNMYNLMKSKKELIQKALGAFQSPDMSDGCINFPHFGGTLSTDRIKTYVQLSESIHNFVTTHKRVSPRVNESLNDKFVFRTWLIRLGMIGNKYKTARAVLTEKLKGNSAWLHPEMTNLQQGYRSNELLEEICVDSRYNSDGTEPIPTEIMESEYRKGQFIEQEEWRKLEI